MKNTNYAGLSMDDIIFENRNKAYGAYELRQSYDRRIRQALVGTMALVALACSYQSLRSLYRPQQPHSPVEISQKLQDVKIETIEIPKPKPAEPTRPKAPAPPKGVSDPPTLRSTAILIPASDSHATDSLHTAQVLATAAPGDQNKAGTTPGDRKGTSDGDLLAMVVTKPSAPAIETRNIAEVMPEYPGGEAAMMRYISENIEYPDADRLTDVQGRVVVGFIVDENGNINDVHVIRGLTRTLNDESIRVVRRLKPFRPGSQGGHPVRVRFTLPISYRLS